MLAIPALAGAGNYRLSTGQPASDVTRLSSQNEVQITPDGLWVFYRSDAEIDEADELWRVSTAGGTPERISGLLPAGENVLGEELTPDGTRLVFSSPQDDVTVHEIFSFPVGAVAGSYVKVNAPVAAGVSLSSFRISPDSSRLLYTSQSFEVPGTVAAQLWVAELDGSDQTSLVTLPLERNIRGFTANDDFTRAIYIADPLVDDRDELWSVAIAGGTPVKLSGALVAGGDVTTVLALPDSPTVLYLADQLVDGRNELFAVPADGSSAAVRLNATPAAGRQIVAAFFTPNGARVLYLEATIANSAITGLYSVAPDGTERVELLGAMVTGGTLTYLTLDSQNMVFIADKLVDERFELFSVPVAGGAIVKLNPTLTANGDVSFADNAGAKLSSDGTHVLYVADQEINDSESLYSVPVGGGTASAIGGPAVLGTSTIRGFSLSTDGERVARVRYYVPFFPGSTPSVHLEVSSTTPGQGWRRVDSTEETGEVWRYAHFVPSRPREIVYIADQEIDEKWELFHGDDCLLCDGFEVGSTLRWGVTVP